EPLARACQSDALAIRRPQPSAVVDHVAMEHVAASSHDDAHGTATDLLAEAVAKRVLDERLEQQIGHARVAHLRFDVENQRKASAEAQPHDVAIPLEKLELRLQRDLLR